MMVRSSGGVPDRLVAFLTGVLVGAALSRVLQGRGDAGAEDTSARPDPHDFRARWSGALGDAVGALASRPWLGRPVVVDTDDLGRALALVPGGARVHVRDLGDGIVEATGECPDADTVGGVLEALRGVPGVAVVVNRIWTEAARSAAADLVHRPQRPGPVPGN